MTSVPSHAPLSQIPTFGFLYVAGYIGYVGREYLIRTKKEAKPTEKEIIIDVPLALNLALNGWAWPVATVRVSIFWALGRPACSIHRNMESLLYSVAGPEIPKVLGPPLSQP